MVPLRPAPARQRAIHSKENKYGNSTDQYTGGGAGAAGGEAQTRPSPPEKGEEWGKRLLIALLALAVVWWIFLRPRGDAQAAGAGQYTVEPSPSGI